MDDACRALGSGRPASGRSSTSPRTTSSRGSSRVRARGATRGPRRSCRRRGRSVTSSRPSRRSDEVAADEAGAADDEDALRRACAVTSATPTSSRSRRARVGDQQVPHDGAEPFGVRRDVIGVERRERPRTRRRLAPCSRRRGRRCRRPWRRRSLASSSARTRLTEMFFSASPPPTEKTSRASSARRREPLSHSEKRGVPALVVDAGGQLGDVVGRRVGLEAADLAEVVDGVAGVAGRAADAEDEQAPAARRGPRPGRSADCSTWSVSSACDDLRGLGEEVLGEVVTGEFSFWCGRGTRRTCSGRTCGVKQRMAWGGSPARTRSGHRSRGS